MVIDDAPPIGIVKPLHMQMVYSSTVHIYIYLGSYRAICDLKNRHEVV